MRKISAILLLTVFLFNMAGYRVVFNYASHQSDARLEASLDDDNYDEAELIAITVPLSVPYQIEQPDFQRVDGEITYKNKLYKYVKRKLTGGNLVLLCLPDHDKMKIRSAENDFYKDTNDLAQTSHSSNTGKKSTFKNSNDYDAFTMAFTAPVSTILAPVYPAWLQVKLPISPLSFQGQPPEVV